MPYFDYKVVPAPRRMKKVRGVKTSDELFALTLAEAINEHARQGWEYVRAENLSAEEPAGWFRRGKADFHSVLIFRQSRETLGPRLAATDEAAAPSRSGVPAAARAEPKLEPAPPRRRDEPVENVFAELAPEPPATDPGGSTPLRPGPRLGPAERN
jgi:hypothetical protein